MAASYPTHSVTELSKAFYKKFKLHVSPSAIGFILWKRKIHKKKPVSKALAKARSARH